MLIQTKEQHIEFLQNSVLNSIKKIVIDQEQTLFGFMLIGQAVEILGSYLDDKPLRVKRQSSKRFELAINRLFPAEYRKINKSNFLYYQLRTFLTHTFIPSGKLVLKNGKSTTGNSHLSYKDGLLILYIKNFYTDLEIAVNKLIELINSDKIRLKKISAGEVI
ncbi:hypothetical protein LJC11_00380 [Bacteroidales bacterium OttesenSCG-928-I21]|nr:hypothetical protein [Bacteroidales bacterium OttesenSCG-928-I21]